MPFSNQVEIPPLFQRIINKIQEKGGQVTIDEFKSIILSIRISREDIDEIEKYLIEKDLIERIPKLAPSGNGGAKTIIMSTAVNASTHGL